MSKLEPVTQVDAFCYQLEDEVRKLRSFGFLGNKDTVLQGIESIQRYLDILKQSVEKSGILKLKEF